MAGFTLSLPSMIVTGVRKKTNRWLNLNGYRNWQHYLNNDLKKKFKEEVIGSIPNVKFNKINLYYKVYLPTQRRTDIANVCSVVDKFFSDTLVEAGVIEDDDYTILDCVVYQYGGIDKDNPRVEVTVKEM